MGECCGDIRKFCKDKGLYDQRPSSSLLGRGLKEASLSGSSKGQLLPKERQTRRQGGSHSLQGRSLTIQGSVPWDLSRAGPEITASSSHESIS